MRIVCISDTHGDHSKLKLPEGDVLIHAGDFTNRGEYHDVASFANWLDCLDFKHKLVVPGNHDISFEKDLDTVAEVVKYSCTLLIDQVVVIDGLRFYGTPWTPNFYPEHWAFNHASPGLHCSKIYKQMVAANPDVVISHGPPYGYCDRVLRGNVGCKELLKTLKVIDPTLTVCGHIHEGYGLLETHFGPVANAAIMDGNYRFINKPIVIDL